ncbi:ABC transporter permease [Gordonia sp. zg691]|uniref:ABC transporter permease n=1 Tax=Gordonia jinghuaiqii TaxID=2758710 RepID=UPI0016628712|nr:ABC transporter permease [Gordonia jinghuaiqii]MBD0859627.1 ABC transporter permease [Gordonia jinghuaiqii]
MTARHETTSRRTTGSAWWRMVGVIVELELRQRLRTTRWKATLGAAFAVTSLAVFGSLYLAVGAFGGTYDGWSSNLYVLLLGFLLLLGIIVAPTLAATTVNGDRKDATLAVVQDTAITNWQLALGKLIGAWVAGMALVAVTAPYLIWGLVEAPEAIGRGLLGLVVLAIVFACYSGIGLGFSAVTARPAGSAVLTQAAVFFLILGLPVLFGLLFPTVAQTHSVIRTETTVTDAQATTPTWQCHEVRKDQEFHHHERIWWLLAPNPFFIVADAVSTPPENPRRYSDSVAEEISRTLSAVRAGPYIGPRSCAGISAFGSDQSDPNSHRAREAAHETSTMGASWYIGLAIYLVLGGLGYVVAARRLRIPAGKLPRGVRIA